MEAPPHLVVAAVLVASLTACGAANDVEVAGGTPSGSPITHDDAPAQPGSPAPGTSAPVAPTTAGKGTAQPTSEPDPATTTPAVTGADEPQPAPRALTEEDAGAHVRMERGSTLELVLDAATTWEVRADSDVILVVPVQSMAADDARWEIRAERAGHATLTARGGGRTLTWRITVP